MRIAVITGEHPHSKHLCAELAREHEVVGVLHPRGPAGGAKAKARRLSAQFRERGAADTALRLLGGGKAILPGWDHAAALADAERESFPDAAERFAPLDAVTHSVGDINGDEGVGLVHRLDPDAVVCLGGPVYRRPLIEACRRIFNFHSGVSPLYNGASTILFAFANGQPHLCGGTLMTMSTTVDGGDILGHYLPAIEPSDTPATLFTKTVAGAAEIYLAFLRDLETTGASSGCPQPPPLFYYRAADWTVYQSVRVSHHLEAGTAGRHVRPAATIGYWGTESRETACGRIRETITGLLGL